MIILKKHILQLREKKYPEMILIKQLKIKQTIPLKLLHLLMFMKIWHLPLLKLSHPIIEKKIIIFILNVIKELIYRQVLINF